MAQHTTDWVLTSQTNSKQTELANLVNRGKVTLYGDTDTGTVQFREGLYGNSNISSLDVASVDSVTVYFTSVKKLPGGTSKFRCRKNGGDGTWLDTEISNSEKTQNKKLNGNFSKSAYYNADLSLVADIWSGNVTYSNVFLRITYTMKSYTLTVNAGSGGTVSGGGTYESGSTATIRATPNSDYRFVRWSDGNTNATRTVTVTANATYSAIFEEIEKPPKFTSVKITPNPVIAGEAFILTVGVE